MRGLPRFHPLRFEIAAALAALALGALSLVSAESAGAGVTAGDVHINGSTVYVTLVPGAGSAMTISQTNINGENVWQFSAVGGLTEAELTCDANNGTVTCPVAATPTALVEAFDGADQITMFSSGLVPGSMVFVDMGTGNDLFVRVGPFDGGNVIADGGTLGTDTLIIDDTAEPANKEYDVEDASLSRNNVTPLQWQQFDDILFKEGNNDSTTRVHSTLPDVSLVIQGNDGADQFTLGPRGDYLDGDIGVNGGLGTDYLTYDDSDSLGSNTYDVRVAGGLVERSAAGAVRFAKIEGISVTGGPIEDTMHVLSTINGVPLTLSPGAGVIDDTVAVWAAGLAPPGDITDLTGDDHFLGDTLLLYTGGLNSTLGSGQITTVGRQTVNFNQFEVTQTVSILPDFDGDGCTDTQEVRGEDAEAGGGDRRPYTQWDFYDVTADNSIDVADVIAILGHFGEPAVGNEIFDRFSPEPAKRYRSAFAGNGIDVVDAITNLQSFGHTCLILP